MSSAFDARHLVATCAIALLACACNAPAQQEQATQIAPVQIPVGPLPGPEESQPHAAQNPFAKSAEALAEGRMFFVQYNCAGCHGEHGGGGMGPSLRDEAWLYGDAHAQVAKSIVEGRSHGMPAWGVMLTRDQVWQITAYIKSMRTPQEPDPPAMGTGRSS